MNHSFFFPLENELNKKGYSTLNYDLRGVGESGIPKKSKKYSLKNHEEDLRKILNKEKIKNPIFVAHSFGFMPVVNYCYKSNNYKSIIAITTSFNFSKTFRLGNIKFWCRLSRYFQHFLFRLYQISHKITKTPWKIPNQAKYKSDLSLVISAVNKPYKKIKANDLLLENIFKIDISKQLKRIRKPLLLILAKQDQLIKPDVYKDFKELMGKNFNYKILSGSHSLPLSKYKKISKLIVKFLQE